MQTLNKNTLQKPEFTIFYPYFFLLLSIILQVIGVIIGKKNGLLLQIYPFFSFPILLGLGIIFIITISQGYFWLKTLKILPLSYAHPFNALIMIIVLILAHLVFSEEYNISNVVGSIIIIIGLLLLSKN